MNYEDKYNKLIDELKYYHQLVESLEHIETLGKSVSLATVKEILDKLLAL